MLLLLLIWSEETGDHHRHLIIRGKAEGFCVNPKDEADAPEAEQKVEKTWDSSDIEFLV